MTADYHESTRAGAWKVLLVDDEPAVHEVSCLILADLTFAGRGIELLSASTARQARELLSQQPDVALVLLDVVMENDDAGLVLIHHIREHLDNSEIQIVLRTGQPGMAPEDSVIRQCAINGYFLKTDITAQRLQSIVISALRSFDQLRSLRRTPDDCATAELSVPVEVSAPALISEQPGPIAVEAASMQVQPELLLASNEVCGAELTPHWRTTMGLMSAARVLEAVPENAQRRQLVGWLLDQAILWARSWQANCERTLSVSVPMVADCLADEETFDMIMKKVRIAALPQGSLDILVSENVLLRGHDCIPGHMELLQDTGVTFTLTDFGDQDFSLQRLSQLAPDRLKIHRLFVSRVTEFPERMAMARSLIALAQTLNIVAIADGITCDRDAQFFKWEGCEIGQGDGIAPTCATADLAHFPHQGRLIAH